MLRKRCHKSNLNPCSPNNSVVQHHPQNFVETTSKMFLFESQEVAPNRSLFRRYFLGSESPASPLLMASLSREHGIAIGILKRGKMRKYSKRVMVKCKAWPRAMVAAIWSHWGNKPCWLISLVLFENRKKLRKFHIRKLKMIINNIFGVGESVRNIMAFGQIVVLCLCRAKLNEQRQRWSFDAKLPTWVEWKAEISPTWPSA